ncbi:MAG TPA: hypothetical protein VHP31_09330 [Caproicibacter sp.]|nr:hypothetical protein [Caproicibacter sp.]
MNEKFKTPVFHRCTPFFEVQSYKINKPSFSNLLILTEEKTEMATNPIDKQMMYTFLSLALFERAKYNKIWLLPQNAERPKDNRRKQGEK